MGIYTHSLLFVCKGDSFMFDMQLDMLPSEQPEVPTPVYMGIDDTYISTLEAMHQCDLLVVHSYNIDTYLSTIYGKEDVDTAPQEESLVKRIWEGIKKFVATIIRKLVELYEWFEKLMMNFRKELDSLSATVQTLGDVSVDRDTLSKLDNVHRPSLGALQAIRNILMRYSNEELKGLVNIEFTTYYSASIGSNYDQNAIIQSYGEVTTELNEAMSSDRTAYGTSSDASDIAASTIKLMLENGSSIVDSTKNFENINKEVIKNLKRVLQMNPTTTIFSSDEAKKRQATTTAMCRTIVKYFNTYTSASSKFVFTIIMITKTFIKAVNMKNKNTVTE